MAQLDYEAIYQEVIDICPNMKSIINYARNIKAARLGEYDYHLNEIHTHSEKESEAFSRLFDMSLRSAIKDALNYHKRYGVDVEDAFQVACIGVVTAIQKHNENVEGLFPSYVAIWICRVLMRELPIYDYNVHIPVNYQERIYHVLKQLSGVFEWSDVRYISHVELYHLILQYSDCDEDEAYRIAYILYPAESFEDFISNEENETFFAKVDNSLQGIMESASYQPVRDALSKLSEKERNVITHRFGFNGKSESTLEEVGQLYGLTRERIRQIESKAMKKIDMYLYKQCFISKEKHESVINKKTRKN